MNPHTIKAYHFFKSNAGYVVGQRAKGALHMAKVERLRLMAEDAGRLSYSWVYDNDTDRGPIDWGWSEKEIARWNQSRHEVEYCDLEIDGECVASLGGIWDADANYRRVVEAELMSEYLSNTGGDLPLELVA